MILVHVHDDRLCPVGNMHHSHAMVEVVWNAVKIKGMIYIDEAPGG
jgi:hypothetical protein